MVGIAPAPAMDAKRLVEDDEPNVSPEEQEAYESFVASAFELIYEGGTVAPKVLAMLDQDPSDLIAIIGDAVEQDFTPQVAVAATAVVVALQVVRDTGEQNDDIIFHGGRAIVEDLCEIAEKVNKTEFSQDQVNQAFAMAADLYREIAAEEGLVDEEALKGAFNELVTADREGRLGEVSPELDTLNKLAEQNLQEGEEPVE